MRTLKVKTGGGGSKFSSGWHTLEVVKAEYGDWNGTKYLDVWFKDYPDSINLRCYAKTGKDGEEFAIGRLFRFANAGIMEVAKSDLSLIHISEPTRPERIGVGGVGV